MTDPKTLLKKPKKRKRIAMVSTHGYVAAEPPLGAPDTGGQVVYVLELSKKLAQFGYQVDIWTRQFEDQPEMEWLDKHTRVLRVPCGGNEFIPKEYLCDHLDEWVDNALHYIDQHDLGYDFINSHYWDAGVAGQKLADALDTTHLHTPHSIGSWKKKNMETDFDGTSEEFEKKYNFAVRISEEDRIYHESDGVVATTPIQYDMIQEDYGLVDEQMAMIPPGYDDNKFFPVGESSREVMREALGMNGKVVFAVSRLARNKGLDLLVDAFKLVADRVDDAKLLLAIGHEDRSPGEEELYQELLAKREEYGLEDRIFFTGFIPDEMLPDYYRAADLFVLSSRYEPFGMTAVEAMACGTPVVATTHGGLFKIFNYGEDILFADVFDKEDLGITMVKALTYPGVHERLQEKGASEARANFTWTSIAQQLISIAEGDNVGNARSAESDATAGDAQSARIPK